MKKSVFLILFAAISLATSAQLKVNSDGKVIIASTQTTPYAKLLVGSTQYGGSVTNVGITGSTGAVSSKSNIGVLGNISVSSGLSSDKNYGVLGVVSPVNITHGRNYGVSGMIGFSGTHCGGAGVYGTN